MRTLRVEVVIIDKDEDTKNPITEDEVRARIADATEYSQKEQKLKVNLKGDIRREIDSEIYSLDSENFLEKLEEWFRSWWSLVGRDSPIHLTIYVIGHIEGQEVLHPPFYGSVFITAENPQTTLAHELVMHYWRLRKCRIMRTRPT